MRYISRRLLLSLVVWVTVLMFGHHPADAQVLSKDNGHKLYAASEYSYAGTANIRFSELGELPGFEYPAGYEHIYVGVKIEGWSISYRVGEEDRHQYTLFDESSGGITEVSYTVIQDDAGQLRVQCKTSTSDGVLEITHMLEMNKAESRVFIHMTVANLSDETVSDIRIKRVCDLDLDTGGEYGWAVFDDWFELAENGVRTYTTDPPEGREAHEMTFYGIPAPNWFGADQWDDWYQRANTTGPEQGFAEADYPVFGDFTATLSWDLGNLSPSSTADTVTAVYQMGVYETQKPNAEATDSGGNAKTLFNPAEDVYVKGSLFLPNSNVDVYVVSDKGWRGGENITGDVGDGMATVSTDGQGNIGPVNVWAAPLVVGQYDIVLDANRDGIYDQVGDAVVGAGDTGFSVQFETDEAVADAVAAGQQYLFNAFVDLENGTGYWPDYTTLAGTCAAVAALIETGKADDPAYLDKIQKGVEYIKQFAKENGGIYDYNQMYETGLALVALSLFDQEHTQGSAYEQMVQNGVDFLKAAQNLDNTSNEYGGWYYYHASRDGDLSNTQFAVMGLWYASRYLGLPVQGTTWAAALLTFLENTQSFHDGGPDDGAFSYFPNTNDFLGGSMTGAGLWCLAMIGQGNNPMVAKAVNWFNQHYTWNRNPGSYYDLYPDEAYYYFVYGMAKGLTANVGTEGMVGAHDWTEDLKNQMVANQHESGYWYRGGNLDPYEVICTSWVLMSLAFADTSTGSTEAFLPDLPNATYPILGLVVLQVGGGATISGAQRLNINPADNPGELNFPIGAFNFVIKHPGASTTVLTITPPGGLWNPENPYSFVNSDESIKDNVEWFALLSPWAGSGAPVEIDPGAQVIRVTLEDGGAGDTDGQVNGEIIGPGAVGNEIDMGVSVVTLPDLIDATYPILGDVSLEVSGGATISGAQRLNINPADNPEGINFPIGGFDFLIEDVSGSATTLTITPPEELWEPSIVSSFVNSDGSTKDVGWFAKLSPWGASGASLEVDREAKVIRVILQDGGPGDSDGEVNGQIAGPGAPGNEVFTFQSPTQKGGTSQGDYRIVSVPLNAVPGATLFEAIDSGVPPEWKYGSSGDIRILVWNVETQGYEEFSRPDSTILFEPPPTSYDMAGVAFWRIARTNHSYEYTGTPLDPEKLPVDSSTESPYFEIILPVGWNQFGFPFSDIDKVHVNDLLISGDRETYIPVTDESNTVTQHTIWEFEDTNGDGDVNDVPGDGTVYDAAATISKGHGYWLYVNAVPEPYTGVALRVLYAPANGISNVSTFSIMSVEGETPPPDPPNASFSVNTGGGSAGGGCFIATAAYGSILHPCVKVLREFRDVYLLTTEPGKRFVAFYYRHGPKAAQVIAAHAPLKLLTRVLLLPLIGYGAFMVYGNMILKLFVMAGLMLLATWVVRRGLRRRPL